MQINYVLPSDLRITSKKTALEFYKGVKACFVIPINYRGDLLRVEPGNCISVINEIDLVGGTAWMVPSYKDIDGTYAYQFRKVINAYLRGGMNHGQNDLC